MTQRIFDIENEKDMQDLWNILPECIVKIKKDNYAHNTYSSEHIEDFYETGILKINWHDKTEITRPIQEATEADIGKLCVFWNIKESYIGKLCHIESNDAGKYYEMSVPIAGNLDFLHCRRLTKQEIEELC